MIISLFAENLRPICYQKVQHYLQVAPRHILHVLLGARSFITNLSPFNQTLALTWFSCSLYCKSFRVAQQHTSLIQTPAHTILLTHSQAIPPSKSLSPHSTQTEKHRSQGGAYASRGCLHSPVLQARALALSFQLRGAVFKSLQTQMLGKRIHPLSFNENSFPEKKSCSAVLSCFSSVNICQ